MLELRRIEDCTPSLRGGEAIATLSEQLSRPTRPSLSLAADEQLRGNNVWSLPGHVFVSFRDGRSLCCFDSVPSSKLLSELDLDRLKKLIQLDRMPGGTGLAQETAARLMQTLTANTGLLLHDFDAPVDGVFPLPTATAFGELFGRGFAASATAVFAVLIVDKEANASVFVYHPSECAWSRLGSFSLADAGARTLSASSKQPSSSSGKALKLVSSILHSKSSSLVYSLFDSVTNTHSVWTRSLLFDPEQLLVSLGTPSTVIQRSPSAMECLALKDAIAIAVLAQGGAAKSTGESGTATLVPERSFSQRLIFWTPRSLALEGNTLDLFVWNHGLVPERVSRDTYTDIHLVFDRFENSSLSSEDRPASGYPRKADGESRGTLLDLLVHRTTGELLAVSSLGSVYAIVNSEGDGWLARKLCDLAEFAGIWAEVSRAARSGANGSDEAPVSPVSTFFTHHFVLGWLVNGECYLFHLSDGSFLTRLSIPYRAPRNKVWYSQGAVPRVGMLNEYGVWQFQTKSVMEQAEFLANSAAGSATSSSAPGTKKTAMSVATDPESYKERLFRAEALCDQWNVQRLHAKYLFDIAFACLRESASSAVAALGSSSPASALSLPQDRKTHALIRQQILVLAQLFADRVLGTPALLVALTGPDSDVAHIINAELERFLNRYFAKKDNKVAAIADVEDRAINESSWLLARNAFHLRTPLSSAIIGLLEEYHFWARLRKDMILSAVSQRGDSESVESALTGDASDASALLDASETRLTTAQLLAQQAQLLKAVSNVSVEQIDVCFGARESEVYRMLETSELSASSTLSTSKAAGSSAGSGGVPGSGNAYTSPVVGASTGPGLGAPTAPAAAESTAGTAASTALSSAFRARALDLERGRLDYLVRHAPLAVLECLVHWLDIQGDLSGGGVEDGSRGGPHTSAPKSTASYDRLLAAERIHGLLFEGESLYRSPKHPLFEIACRLMLLHKPQYLNAFVKFAHQSASFAAAQGSSATTPMASPMKMSSVAATSLAPALLRYGRDRSGSTSSLANSPSSVVHPHYYRRAMLCLLPLVAPHSAVTLSRESSMALVELLCSNFLSAAPIALRFLLQQDMFAEAFELLRTRSKQDVEHFELFHVLLTTLLKRDLLATHADRLWVSMPKNFNAYELLSILRVHFAEEETEQPRSEPHDHEPDEALAETGAEASHGSAARFREAAGLSVEETVEAMVGLRAGGSSSSGEQGKLTVQVFQTPLLRMYRSLVAKSGGDL